MMHQRKQMEILLSRRWPWHALFWIGYALFRFWLYYITVQYYPRIFLEYMLLSELMFVAIVYFTVWLYKRLFDQGKYLFYFLAGTGSWILYLCARTVFQLSYLQKEPGFKGNTFTNIFVNNVTVIIVCFLFVTACKYFKDGYIKQQFESEKNQQQLIAEVNNLKSQIAPHFLFNTLNNLYGLAVDKSDKLPNLMLRLSDLLRHSLYKTQKPLVPITEEVEVLESYIELERIRLESSLEMEFENNVPVNSTHEIAPLLLIVFVENAFKHAKFVQPDAVHINIKTLLEKDYFKLILQNNYNSDKPASENGIGLINVKRRLEVLYPGKKHSLMISKDDKFYTVNLELQLTKRSE